MMRKAILGRSDWARGALVLGLFSWTLAACGSTKPDAPHPVALGASTVASATAAVSASAAPAAPVASAPCVTRVGAQDGGFAAGHPYWSVAVHREGVVQTDSLQLFGEIDTGHARVTEGPRFEAYSSQVVALPSKNAAIAFPTEAGTTVLFDGDKPILLPEKGALKATDSVLLIGGSDLITVYDTATWTKRFSTKVTALQGDHTPRVMSVTPDKKYLVALAGDIENTSVVIDLATGKAVVEDEGIGAISPDGVTLALFRTAGDAAKWMVRLYTVSAPSKSRDVKLDLALIGPTSPHFATAQRLEILGEQPAAMMHFPEQTLLAWVDVGSARATKVTNPTSHVVDDESSRFRALESVGQKLLPRGRYFVANSLHQVPSEGPTASGFFAAETSTTRDVSASSVDEAHLFIADTKTRKFALDVPLPEGFTVDVLQASDDRYVVACGRGTNASGAMIVDALKGRTMLNTSLTSCFETVIDGHYVWTPEGVLDLEAETWPTLLPFDTSGLGGPACVKSGEDPSEDGSDLSGSP